MENVSSIVVTTGWTGRLNRHWRTAATAASSSIGVLFVTRGLTTLPSVSIGSGAGGDVGKGKRLHQSRGSPFFCGREGGAFLSAKVNV